MADPRTRARTRLLRGVAAVGLALLLQACGPGTGGTGLPPGSGATDAASSLALAPSIEALPGRTPDLAGPLQSVDAGTLGIAGTSLPRAGVSLRDPAGAPLPADAARVGLPARAWRVGDGWVVALGG
jgi:hypothetical protein